MRTLLGMQYGGNIQQQYPRRELQLQPKSFQEGGGVSAGLAGLKRLIKKREASDVYGEEQAEQVEKQKKAGLFGSLLALGSGAGAAWLTPLLLTNPATAALALPWLVGGATGAGKYIGEKAGYGGEQVIDTDMMYAKEVGLEDIERAGEEYQSGMGERAALAGLKSGLMAGFAPDTSMFGKIADRPLYASGVSGEALKLTPGAYYPSAEAELAGGVLVPEFGAMDYFNFQDGGMINQQPNTLLGYLTR